MKAPRPHASPRSDFRYSFSREARPAALPKAGAPGHDKALTNYALGMLSMRGCACRVLPDYRAFIVRASFRNPFNGARDTCNLTVSACGGVLTVETVALPLPPSPWLPLREALNAINWRSGGSVFLLRECGVVLRLKLLPHAPEQGLFSVEELLAALRQLNYERRLALLPLSSACRKGFVDRAAIEQAFAQPLARETCPALTLPQLQDLAVFSGYHAQLADGHVYLSRERRAASDCPVQMNLRAGVVRGWTPLGGSLRGFRLGPKWVFLRRMLRKLVRGRTALTKSELGRLLERLNALNDGAGLLRYVWTGRRVVAMAAYAPLEKAMGVEEFQCCAEALFRRVQESARRSTRKRRAV